MGSKTARRIRKKRKALAAMEKDAMFEGQLRYVYQRIQATRWWLFWCVAPAAGLALVAVAIIMIWR